MRSIKLLLLMLFLLGSAFTNPTGQAERIKWILTEGGSLTVGGSTNVNRFNCVIAKYTLPDTLLVSGNTAGLVKISGSLVLDLRNFDCHNPVMTKDLRKTLRADEFPHLKIRFLALDRYPGAERETINGTVLIELAGVVRQYEVSYLFTSAGFGTLSFTGKQQVRFSDFNLTPPRKIGGMIKTRNELSVTFTLTAGVLN